MPLGDIREDSTLVHEPVSKKHRAEAFLVDSPEVLSIRQKEPGEWTSQVNAYLFTVNNLASGCTKLAGPSGNRAKGELPFH